MMQSFAAKDYPKTYLQASKTLSQHWKLTPWDGPCTSVMILRMELSATTYGRTRILCSRAPSWSGRITIHSCFWLNAVLEDMLLAARQIEKSGSLPWRKKREDARIRELELANMSPCEDDCTLRAVGVFRISAHTVLVPFWYRPTYIRFYTRSTL